MQAKAARAAIVLVLSTLFLILPAVSPTVLAGLPPAAWTQASTGDAERALISPDQLVGNVGGTVKDAETLAPIRGADVFLLEQPVQKGGSGDTIHTDRGDIVSPDVRRAAMRGSTNEAGEFLVNFVPTPFPSKAYTIVITASGYGLFIADSAMVLPGAVMSLNVDAELRKDINVLFEPGDRAAPLKYRHETGTLGSVPRNSPAAPSSGDDRVAYTIYATREGLVGYTTANKHIIQAHDRFVALPSPRVLNADDQTYIYQVRLTYAGRTVDAPVWDVGPWNISDDYWNPPGVRERWQDLPQGMPEAQAAYQNKYNGGLDQYGRKVTAPTAIDLADGTFWDDLGMTQSNWISVKYLWKPNVVVGDRVYATSDLPVRATPGGNQAATEPCGAEGTITGGAVGATLNRVFYVWWQIQWDNAIQGWSAENQLGKAPVPSASLGVNPDDPTQYDGQVYKPAEMPASAPLARQQNGTIGFQYFFPVVGKCNSIGLYSNSKAQFGWQLP